MDPQEKEQIAQEKYGKSFAELSTNEQKGVGGAHGGQIGGTVNKSPEEREQGKTFHEPQQNKQCRNGLQRRVWSQYQAKHCFALKEATLSQHLQTDKLFAVEWLNWDHVVWGTKCNKFLVQRLSTGKVTDIPLPVVPPDVSRPKELENRYGKCGIHAIAINPSRTLVATGGAHPNDAQVFKLPECTPACTLIGHQDWVFGLTWLTDKHLVTGGRDGTVKLWDIEPGRGACSLQTEPQTSVTVCPKGHKVRDISRCSATGSLYALNPEGVVYLLDPYTMHVHKKWSLPSSDDDWICFDSQQHLAVAGSSKELAILDSRIPDPASLVSTSTYPPLQPTWTARHFDDHGLRSVRINTTIISCGGSFGTLSFYDMRAGKWAHEQSPVLHPSPCGPIKDPSDAETDWLMESYDSYMTHPAIYCHAWDKSGQRLIAGGGPLIVRLKGVYAALWS